MPIVSNTTEGSSVESWVRHRLTTPHLAESVKSALQQLMEVLETERSLESDVFLSVVIRTQAKRWEQVQDALLCLAAQTDDDFEVLLMLHEVDEERTEQVQDLVHSYPASFANRVRLFNVSGGGRTRPLSESVRHTRGKYLAFFDDDDLLMGNWVETFRHEAERAPAQLIRANVAVQHNEPEVWTDGSSGQRTVSVASAEYARTFNFADNIERNHTPFMGFAFPSSFFNFWGERFDEDLPVCEDWDVVMRAALLLGVSSSEQLTAIYRQWEGAQTSYTSHAELEWREAESEVLRKINKAPFLAPAGGADHVLEMAERFRANELEIMKERHKLLNSVPWKMLAPVRFVLRGVRKVIPRRSS